MAEVEKKERKRVSLPPFTTSTLQQAAANKLGFSAKQTMTLAQQLYEEGLITYHRTDSVNLAQSAISMAREYIAGTYGSAFVPPQPRYFKNSSKNAQEAHEAIRPTDVQLINDAIIPKAARISDKHVKLYDLIWRRFVASQMEAAIYDQTSITVKAEKSDFVAALKAAGSVVKFAGWTQVMGQSEDVILPNVTTGEALDKLEINSAQKFTQPPPRYNDASLVKELEKRGIGRPSTYASIISVIVDRGYVERTEKKFWATQIGEVVCDFLTQHFPEFMNFDFTAEMEENLDRVARGEMAWKQIVSAFYLPLKAKIDIVIKDADRAKIPVEETGESCPLCGVTEKGMIVIRSGKFGKFKSCSRYPECKFTQNIVAKLEGRVCPLCAKGDIISKKSRWGKPFFGCSLYPTCDWASWQAPEFGLVVTQAEWDIQKAARAAKKAAREEKNGGAGKFAKKSKSVRKSNSRQSTTAKPTLKKTAKKTTRKTSLKKSAVKSK